MLAALRLSRASGVLLVRVVCSAMRRVRGVATGMDDVPGDLVDPGDPGENEDSGENEEPVELLEARGPSEVDGGTRPRGGSIVRIRDVPIGATHVDVVYAFQNDYRPRGVWQEYTDSFEPTGTWFARFIGREQAQQAIATASPSIGVLRTHYSLVPYSVAMKGYSPLINKNARRAVVIAGLSADTTERDIVSFFKRDYAIVSNGITFYRKGETTKVFVIFQSAENATHAVREMHQKLIRGRTVHVLPVR